LSSDETSLTSSSNIKKGLELEEVDKVVTIKNKTIEEQYRKEIAQTETKFIGDLENRLKKLEIQLLEKDSEYFEKAKKYTRDQRSESEKKLEEKIRADLSSIYTNIEVLSGSMQVKYERMSSDYEKKQKQIEVDLNNSIERINNEINMTLVDINNTFERLRLEKERIDKKIDDGLEAIDKKGRDAITALKTYADLKYDAMDSKINDGLYIIDRKFNEIDKKLNSQIASAEDAEQAVNSAIDALKEDTAKIISDLEHKTNEQIDRLDTALTNSILDLRDETQRSIDDIRSASNEQIEAVRSDLLAYLTKEEFNEYASSTEERLKALEDKSEIGEVFIWLKEECPVGSVPLDGAYIGGNDALVLAVGNDELPDMRDMFLRVYDDRTDRDILSYQADEIKAHSHEYIRTSFGIRYANGSTYGDYATYYPELQKTSVVGGDETRPKNKYVNLCIKTK